MNNLTIRPAEKFDFTNIINYFLQADEVFLVDMGVDVSKLPSEEKWLAVLIEDFQKPLEEKSFYYLIWELNNKTVGHSNINQITFGERANFHLHLWNNHTRQKGLGFEFIKRCIPEYFEKFKLKKLYCEPYALNPAPNKILKRLGFEFVEKYETIPGSINFMQAVNKWVMDVKKYKQLF